MVGWGPSSWLTASIFLLSSQGGRWKGLGAKEFLPRVSKTDVIPTAADLECLSLPRDWCQHFQPFLCKCPGLWVPSTLLHRWSQASPLLLPATLKTLITFPFSYSQGTLSLSFFPFLCKFFPSSCFYYQMEDFHICPGTHILTNTVVYLIIFMHNNSLHSLTVRKLLLGLTSKFNAVSEFITSVQTEYQV